jgi:hypothetical protein
MNQSENRLDERLMSLHRVFRCIAENEGHETRTFANAHVLTKEPLFAEGPSINRWALLVNGLMKYRLAVTFETGYEDKTCYNVSYDMPISSGKCTKMGVYSHLVTSLTVHGACKGIKQQTNGPNKPYPTSRA